MPQDLTLQIHPDNATDEGLKAAAALALGVPLDRLTGLVQLRRSIDARGRRIQLNYRVRVYADEPFAPPSPMGLPTLNTMTSEPLVAIIGAGPAGMYAAWGLARAGIPSVIFERGSDVRGRRPALASLNRTGILDPENNYCFGEGGAGTFSDGKLYTRVKKGPTRTVLELLVGCGAPEQILVDTRPHVGTNRLPKVIQGFREYLLSAGVQFRFDTRIDDLILDKSGTKGVVLSCGTRIPFKAVVLATGHSARDVYTMLHRQGVSMASKPYAIGVRIEHPQAQIDRIQYGALAGHPNLGAAPYSLKRTTDGIGAYSFCMCPGGFIVPATTDAGHVVVNGMSPSKRDSEFANSGFVITVDESVYGGETLDGLNYQAQIEQAAFAAGGGRYKAPAQRLSDFLTGHVSSTLPATSYRPGLESADLASVLPSRIYEPMRDALQFFGHNRMRGYLSAEAVVVGVESRSSAPVRIPRDPITQESISTSGLYPCGEGAGYAGGIVSAALDGLRVADAIALSIGRGVKADI
jgi:uncharacterized FAD-dependent dehydrogenase